MWVWRVSSWTIRPIVFSGKFSRIFCSVRVKFQNSENTRTVAMPCTGEISDSSKPPAQYPYPVRAKSRNLKKCPYNPQDMYGRNLENIETTRINPTICTGEISKVQKSPVSSLRLVRVTPWNTKIIHKRPCCIQKNAYKSFQNHIMMWVSKVLLPLTDIRIAPLLRNSRNSTHIRNPLIFLGKSQGHQSKIDDSAHVCAGQQVRTLFLQAGTISDFWPLYH